MDSRSTGKWMRVSPNPVERPTLNQRLPQSSPAAPTKLTIEISGLSLAVDKACFKIWVKFGSQTWFAGRPERSTTQYLRRLNAGRRLAATPWPLEATL